jgi:hypothetical protein
MVSLAEHLLFLPGLKPLQPSPLQAALAVNSVPLAVALVALAELVLAVI